MRFIGSACSLLVLLMKNNVDLFPKEEMQKYSYFVAAAVMLDTHNFKELLRDSKWQKEDQEAHEWLLQYTELGTEYFDKMQNNKFNQEIALSFGLQGNFRRDYKTYKLKKGDAAGKFGCAVMVFQPWTMFEKYGHDQCCSEIDEFMTLGGLSLFGMVCNVMNPDTGKNEKTLLMYSKQNDSLANTFDTLLIAMKESTLLKTMEEHLGSFGTSKYAYY